MCGPATNIDVPPLPKRGPYSISEARYSGVVRHPEDLAEGSDDVRGWMLYALLLPADRVKTRVFARVWAGTEGGRYAYEESTTSMARAIGCSSPSVRQALADLGMQGSVASRIVRRGSWICRVWLPDILWQAIVKHDYGHNPALIEQLREELA